MVSRIDLRRQYTDEIEGWDWEFARTLCQDDENACDVFLCMDISEEVKDGIL